MARLPTRCISVLSTLLCLGPMSLAQLETRSSSVVLYEPYVVASGDFNKDDIQDLALVCSPECGVQVLLSKGNGTFEPGVAYAAGDSPEFGIAVADFNGDGNLDIVVSDYLADTVAVLLGNGDGTFQSAIESTAPAGGGQVAIGDFNDDKIPDLAVEVADCPGPCISILLGNGDGTFQPAMNIMLSEFIEAFALGDFNGDGNLDIVWGSSISSNINILLGDGDGTFRRGASYSTTSGCQAAGIAAGDFNGDKILDLAVGTGGAVDVFLGKGDGTFNPPKVNPIELCGSSMTIADMNGDGIPDLVFPSGEIGPTSTLAIMLGQGSGAFGPETLFPTGEDGYFIAAADFNGDHQTDVAVAAALSNAVVALLNTGVVVLSPTTPLMFLTQVVNTTSAPQTVKLTNTGAAPLSISSIKDSGQFGETSTCGRSVASGSTCSISVTFKPMGIGNKSGLVTIVDSASSKPQVIELNGTGTYVSLSASKLNFGTHKEFTNTTLPVEMTNTGPTAIQISQIETSSSSFSYSETNSCGTQLGAGATCTINVTFSPEKKGQLSGSLSITDNGGGSPQTVALTGTGD